MYFLWACLCYVKADDSRWKIIEPWLLLWVEEKQDYILKITKKSGYLTEQLFSTEAPGTKSNSWIWFFAGKNFIYKGFSMEEIIHHLAVFVSRLWQIHIFGEENTRATAVFLIKYLRTLGFSATNDIFAKMLGILEMHLSRQIIRTCKRVSTKQPSIWRYSWGTCWGYT